jgi:3-hydroxy-9,10-secoandrosta-1,3,5(10)-triene-9,17-dione monooxygenase reductase component
MLNSFTASDATFRRALGAFASTVTIITTFDDEDHPVGMTATAFAPVSASSLLVLACVNEANRSLGWILDRGRFGVNILDSDLRAQSDHCARPGQLKTLDQSWLDNSRWQTPAMADTLAFLDCQLTTTTEAGSHRILIGEVRAIGLHKEEPARMPLVYYRGMYRSIGYLPGPRELAPLPIVV